MPSDPATSSGQAQVVREQLLALLIGGNAHMTFEQAVADFPAEHYNTKPPHVNYTPWHILEHLRIAQEDILRYTLSAGWTSPGWPDGYWPEIQSPTGEQWEASLAAFLRDLEEVVAEVGLDAQGLAEGSRKDVDAVHDVVVLVGPAAGLAHEADGVGVVDDHQGVVLVGKITDSAQVGDDAADVLGAEGQHGAARVEVIERFLLDGIDTETGRAAVGNEPDFVVQSLADVAQAALAFAQSAVARTEVALQAAIGRAVPVLGADNSFLHA